MIFMYWFGCFNSLTTILHAQYVNKGHYVMKDEEWFNSIISSLVPIGAIIGAPLGGPLASIGRRQAILITSILFTIGCILTLIFNFFCLLIGRFIIGLWVGAYTSISPMFISEIAPKSISGPLGTSNQLMAMVGVTIAYLLGFKVPVQDDPGALTTGIWRLIFLLPGVVTLIQFLLMLFVFTYDSPYYYESQRDKINYRATITKIYHGRKPSADEALNGSGNEQLANNGSPFEDDDSWRPKDISWGELIRRPYQKALRIGVLLSIFHQATGISFIIFYSNEIFIVGNDGAEAERAARWGTFLVGIFGVVGSVLGILLAGDFGRRNVSLFGLWTLGIIHGILFAVAKDEAYSHLVKYLIIVFFIFLQCNVWFNPMALLVRNPRCKRNIYCCSSKHDRSIMLWINGKCNFQIYTSIWNVLDICFLPVYFLSICLQ